MFGFNPLELIAISLVFMLLAVSWLPSLAGAFANAVAHWGDHRDPYAIPPRENQTASQAPMWRGVLAFLLLGAHCIAFGVCAMLDGDPFILAGVLFACGALFFWFAYEVFRRRPAEIPRQVISPDSSDPS